MNPTTASQIVEEAVNNAPSVTSVPEQVTASTPTFVEQVHNIISSWFNDPIFIFVAGLTLLALFFWYIGSDRESTKRNAGSLFILGLVAFSLFSLYSNKINYGIDIQGGVSFTLQVKPKLIDGVETLPTKEGMQRAADTVRDRIDSTGAKEPVVMVIGEDKILVQIPTIDPDEIEAQKDTITRIAHLELLPVHPNNAQLVANRQEFVPGYQRFSYEYKDDEGNSHSEILYLSKRESLTGSDVKHAQPDGQRPGIVNVTLSQAGGEKMRRITSEMEHGRDRLAVVLDGRVVTAPVVQSTLSSSFQVSGMDAPGEAQNLSNVLNNPLESPLEVLSQSNVSATLGQSALEQGELAGMYGLLIIFILVTIYYRFAGIVAMAAIVINAAILLGAMSLFGFTLTLPGIAGIILTLGVAIDANVLIYERLREEKEAKRNIFDSLTISFDKAFSAIFDSNITSLLTAVILFGLASGSIKGFAVTTSVGILTSMIGALVVTRVLFFWAYKIGFVNERMKFLNIFRKSNIDFLGKRKIAFVICLLMCIATFAGIFQKREGALGIEFTGGASISYEVPPGKTLEYKDVNRVVETLNPQLAQAANAQEFGTPNGNSTIMITCAESDMQLIIDTIAAKVPGVDQIKAPSKEVIGPVLGKEFLKTSLIALAVGLLGIMVYLAVRFEWAFSVGAVVSIFFNSIIVLGAIILSGGQLSLIHVGAILTVIGYTVNDTIVIFDRIREVLKFSDGTEDMPTLMNEAINATLSRTILTSGSTLACIISLYMFGGPALQDFSFAILVGIVVGTFSSIFVASPVVLFWSRKNSLHAEVNRNLSEV